MNVYDFDKTIYCKDSSFDFFFFCLGKDITLLRHAPRMIYGWSKYLAGKISKTQGKEYIFSFLCSVKDIDAKVNEFWEKKFGGIYPWYLAQKKEDDVIISASPEFLLSPVCARLGVRLICSKVDRHSGKFDGENCYGKEKVVRFCAIFGETEIDEFYSDSYSDAPLARLAKKAYLVSGAGVREWESDKM